MRKICADLIVSRDVMHLRKLEAHEVEFHRELRLRALREAPDCFADSYAEIAARPQSYWEELTNSVTQPDRHVMFLACEGDGVVGSTYGLLDRDRSEGGRVGGMWVEPVSRRNGVGRLLLQEVFNWARARHLSRLGLWVPTQSPAALHLYSSAGFQPTGRRQPLPANPSVQTIEMEAPV